MAEMVDEIFDLFSRFGSETYGEGVSLERHMIQCAVLARDLGASDALVAAALLHDIGHFLSPDAEDAAIRGVDLAHEALGAAWLSRGFGREVTQPIALHVQAKRYLCAVEPGYFDGLSDASRRSLGVQGGPLTPAEVSSFARHPAFEGALTLRRCDDRGKNPNQSTPSLEAFRTHLMATLRVSVP
jgi:phosphonate degradation associated HDIG domain protein